MNECSKYSLNGVYRCENFVEHLVHNDFPRFPIGSAGGVNGWYITFRVKGAFVYPLINCNDEKPTLVLRRYFNIIKKDGSSVHKAFARRTTTSSFNPKGLEMDIRRVLNENAGYLDDDGALTVEYGIHVDAILGKNNIWKFNFYDKFYNPYQNQMVEFPKKHLYAHKQFVSKRFETYFKLSRKPKSDTEQFLQIVHGVRSGTPAQYLSHILSMAHKMRLHNVTQYCDQRLVRSMLLDGFEFINYVVQFELRHTLAYMVKNCESFEKIVGVIEELDIEKMSGETMKTFAAKIFTRKF